MSRDSLQRETLPIPDASYVGLTTYDAKDPNSKFPPIEALRPPEGAPNILIVLIDDAGFGASSAFGGPCRTPVAEKLASTGLKFNRFHTTALCSPTRQALLTGRTITRSTWAALPRLPPSAPGDTSVRPEDMAPVAEIFKLNGYATAQLGKCHEVPVWETSPVGPFDRWPSREAASSTSTVHRRRGQSVVSLALRGHRADRAGQDPGGGLSPGRRYDDQGDQVDPPAEGADARTSPSSCTSHPAQPTPRTMFPPTGREEQGPVRPGLGHACAKKSSRGKGTWGHPEDAVLTPRPSQIPAWDDMPEELKPVLHPGDGSVFRFMEYTDEHFGDCSVRSTIWASPMTR